MGLGERGGHRRAVEPVRPRAGDAVEADALRRTPRGSLARGRAMCATDSS
jgi:hypothetical protein